MSWHNAGAIVHASFGNDPMSLFALLGLGRAERMPNLDATFGSEGDDFSNGLGVASPDSWTCLVGMEMSLAIQQHRVTPLAAQADVLAWELEGSCGYAHFQWWAGGAKVREWQEMEGAMQTNFGRPLFDKDDLPPEEIDSEERVFLAMSAVALPIERLMGQVFAAYVFRPNRLREWLRRWFRI